MFEHPHLVVLYNIMCLQWTEQC